MYSEINTYIAARVAEVNALISGTASDLVPYTANLNQAELPENQLNYTYFLKLDNAVERENTIAPCWIVDGIIELSFETTADEVARYQAIVDSYVFMLMKKMRTTRQDVSGTIRFELDKIRFDNLNTFTDNGMRLKPRILFELMYMEV